ncbi:Hepatitis A virus cellular receptor 1 like [Quillaja saponaria]|uniref:Hepatitis A virus cellular receptor 1 like n=1 Tax=Quillaja saponaria TaxID=32244 RepID=A0AAD7VPC8_QUISA|nr:Hepatitis A virus cellular receptor 1 like [Quillaja saponaria]
MANSIRNEGTGKLKKHLSSSDFRDKARRILMNFGQFVVDSAINNPLKTVTGRKQIYNILQEGLTDHAQPLSQDKKSDKLATDEIHIKIEEVKEDTNNLKQKYKTSTKNVEGSEPPKKKSEEGYKGPELLKNNGRRLFIRSRL